MTCKEAEQQVLPYINDELTDKELGSFLDHIHHCSACYEELEIYYTLYMGLAQLDGEDESAGQDMHHLLKEALHASGLRVQGHRLFNIFYVLTQVLAMAVLAVLLVVELI